MPKIFILICILICFSMVAQAISVYQVLFTSSRGSDGTFPSSYLAKEVSLKGIVTATYFQEGIYFISEKLNGPLRGILILNKGE
ncbi:MAG TPA: hypothetical protein PKU76_01400 [Candidatus Cloacimonas sp.]|nr:hypothetical protein [Candidatus Cloacimonas sp.]